MVELVGRMGLAHPIVAAEAVGRTDRPVVAADLVADIVLVVERRRAVEVEGNHRMAQAIHHMGLVVRDMRAVDIDLVEDSLLAVDMAVDCALVVVVARSLAEDMENATEVEDMETEQMEDKDYV